MKDKKENNGKIKAFIKMEIDEDLKELNDLDLSTSFNSSPVKKPIDSTFVEVTNKKVKKCQSKNLM
jgi:hypothetical protein